MNEERATNETNDNTTLEKPGQYEKTLTPFYGQWNKQGRNDKCRCGSGLKHKWCCWRK